MQGTVWDVRWWFSANAKDADACLKLNIWSWQKVIECRVAANTIHSTDSPLISV